MPRLLLLLLFCGLFATTHAQQYLAAARQSSYLTKVFRLTEAQTRHLYQHGVRAARPAFFAVPVDSFSTDSLRPRPLPPIETKHSTKGGDSNHCQSYYGRRTTAGAALQS